MVDCRKILEIVGRNYSWTGYGLSEKEVMVSFCPELEKWTLMTKIGLCVE